MATTTAATVVVAFLLVLSLAVVVRSRPEGAPAGACSSLRPSHPATDRNDPPGGYFIYTELLNNGNNGTYMANMNYDVTLASPDGTPFLGFVIQAREASNSNLIGSFMVLDSSNSQRLNCPGNGAATVTHSNNNQKTRVSFVWTSPSSTGSVMFMYSIVTGYRQDFFANLNAAEYRPGCPFPPTQNGDHAIRIGLPSGCSGTSCNYYVGLNQNEDDPTYLDVYLEGEAAGWTAIGFSMDKQMGADDVLGCRVDSSNVIATDTWNVNRMIGNEADATQNDTCQHFGSFTNGRITCSFSRLIDGSDSGQDYNLNDTFYFFFGRRLTAQPASSTNFASHRTDMINPVISGMTYNPVLDEVIMQPNLTNNMTGCPPAPAANAQYTFQVGSPGDDYYLAVRTNSDNSQYVDILLEGDADGWVAVGLSDNRQMENDDVLGCIRDPNSNNRVSVVDANNPSRQYSANQLDTDQSGLCAHSTNFNNGRVTCSFSRLIQTMDSTDRNLRDRWYLFYARSNTGGPNTSGLPKHTGTPPISPVRASLVLDTGAENNITNNMTCPPSPAAGARYTFQVGSPGDDYYLAVRNNSDNPLYVDILLEGDADGWVAVGLSENRQMENDDVLGCIRDPNSNNQVSVVDANNPSRQYSANQLDIDQSGLCTHSTNFNNGRVTCSFSRLIQTMDSNDRNLRDRWYLFYARSNTGGPNTSGLPRHTGTPPISAERASLVLDAGAAASDFPRVELLKVHGILMIVTWPLMVVTAIFFAAWMRPALPNGEWFQVHRVFMAVALVLGTLGFIFAFVANADNATPGLISFACSQNTAHFALGLIVYLLQIANPIIAAFRCAPNGKNRWIFNLTHGTLIGFIAELLALANVGIGIALFESGGCNTFDADQYTILWVYIGFVAFLLLLQMILFVVFTIIAFGAEPEKRAALAPTMLKYFLTLGDKKEEKKEKPIEMTDPAKESKPSNDPPPRKPPSKDAPVRWGGLVIFMPVTLALLLAVIILVIIQ